MLRTDGDLDGKRENSISPLKLRFCGGGGGGGGGGGRGGGIKIWFSRTVAQIMTK